MIKRLSVNLLQQLYGMENKDLCLIFLALNCVGGSTSMPFDDLLA